jgi:hypothetical protein
MADHFVSLLGDERNPFALRPQSTQAVNEARYDRPMSPKAARCTAATPNWSFSCSSRMFTARIAIHPFAVRNLLSTPLAGSPQGAPTTGTD